MNLPPFIEGYVNAALLYSHPFLYDEEGNDTGDWTSLEQADYSWKDLAPEAQDSVVEDCERFLHDHRELIPPELETRAGIDFYLTRNRHGAGFWDGYWEHGDRLTEGCRPYGSAEFYLGNDGRIYHEG